MLVWLISLFVEMIMIMMEMVIMVIGDFFRGVGVIAYMLVSGGVSPFWAGNRYRTMAKVISLISQWSSSLSELTSLLLSSFFC